MKLLPFTWLRIEHIPFRSQHPLSEQGTWAATALEPHAAVSCTATEPQTLPLHKFYLFLCHCCLGLWKGLFQGPCCDGHQEQQFCCCSLGVDWLALLLPFSFLFQIFDLLKNCLREKKQGCAPKSQLWECLLFLAALIFIPYLLGILPCAKNVGLTAQRSKHEVFYQYCVFLPPLCNFRAVRKKKTLKQKSPSSSVCENLCTKKQL